jgi:hypothetical protein
MTQGAGASAPTLTPQQWHPPKKPSPHVAAQLPTIDLVPDLAQDPDYPPGYDSAPDPNDPAALVHSLGIASVMAFAMSYPWSTSDQRKSARGWAADAGKNAGAGVQWAATLRDYGSHLADIQKASLNYACNEANDIQTGGDKTFVPQAFVKDGSATAENVAGVAFPANFVAGSGDSGQTTYELGPKDAKALAFAQLISDVRKGAYLMGAAVA